MSSRVGLTLALLSGLLGALAIIVGALSAHTGLSYAVVRWIEIGRAYHLPHLVALWGALLASLLVVSYDADAARYLSRAAIAWACRPSPGFGWG